MKRAPTSAAGDARQGAADEHGDGRQAVDVDALKRRPFPVLGDGQHGLPVLGEPDEEEESGYQHEAGDDDDQPSPRRERGSPTFTTPSYGLLYDLGVPLAMASTTF